MHHPTAISTNQRLFGQISPVTTWLFSLVGLVVCMIALGGITRLTDSGLSMVEWNLHHILPPLTEAQWLEAFTKYQASPEYVLKNQHMDLAGYKGIFWLEYLHRLLGRFLGLAFVVPYVCFVFQNRLSRPLKNRLAIIFLLGAAQGVMGWLMVASGLDIRPDVSHYRLAAHLLLALALFVLLLWTALDQCQQTRLRQGSFKARMGLICLMCLVGVTICWGAFVAGLNAGTIHNSFPLMDNHFFPQDGLILQPHLLNPIENPAAIQYVHRILAMTSVLTITLFVLWSQRVRLSVTTRKALTMAGVWVWVQMMLGIATLLTGVNIALASLHQMGAVVLVGLLTWALHSVWVK